MWRCAAAGMLCAMHDMRLAVMSYFMKNAADTRHVAGRSEMCENADLEVIVVNNLPNSILRLVQSLFP